jgi:hypothetical protein
MAASVSYHLFFDMRGTRMDIADLMDQLFATV